MRFQDEMAIDNKAWMTMNIIWFALLASLGIYVFIGLAIQTDMQVQMDDQVINMLRVILIGMAAFELILTIVLRKAVSSGKLGKLFFAQKSNYHSAETDPVMGKYTVMIIISSVIAESVGIYGLVLYFLSQNMTDLVSFNCAAAVAMVFLRPRKEEILSIINNLKKESR